MWIISKQLDFKLGLFTRELESVLRKNLGNRKDAELDEIPLQNHIYPTPPVGQDMTQGQFFKWSLTGLNSKFSFS